MEMTHSTKWSARTTPCFHCPPFQRQCPPFTFSGSSPFQRKLIRRRSICSISHFCVGKTVRWMGSDDKTHFTNVSLPAVDKNFPFQPGNLAPTLSISGWTSTLRRRLLWSGSPRYLRRKEEIFPRKFYNASVMMSFVHLIGNISILLKLIFSPEQSPNKFRDDLCVVVLPCLGLQK